jgi:hypothetical protein
LSAEGVLFDPLYFSILSSFFAGLTLEFSSESLIFFILPHEMAYLGGGLNLLWPLWGLPWPLLSLKK